MGWSYSLILDENLEHEVLSRLEDRGHDVTHVDFTSSLGKGIDDDAIADYSRDTDRFIVTYDDDFLTDVPPSAYRACILIENQDFSAEEIADIVHGMSRVYPPEEVHGIEKVGRDWIESA